MGYYINMRGCKFFMSASDKDKALKAIKKMFKPRVTKGGKSETMSYGWVNKEDILKAEKVEDALSEFGYSPDLDENGNINYLCLNNEKLGDENYMFDAIAPYVKKGSYIEISGEEDSIWRWTFDGKKMKEKSATVTF